MSPLPPPLRAVAALSAALAAIAPGLARARTSPSAGAVAAPAALALRAPFPCGTAYRVSCGYGPSCSGAHLGTTNTSSSNDYYALDFVRAGGDAGRDKPVTAVAPGVVRYAGWSTDGWASYGQIVLLEHDIGDGHRYSSLYAHLQRVSVEVGQRVAASDTVGTMGGSAYGGYDGYATHLHFAMYRDAKIGGGPYGGVAVVPEPLGDAASLATGMTPTASCEPPPAPAEPARPAEPDPGPLALPDLGVSPDAGGPLIAEDDQPFGATVQPGRYPDAYGGCSGVPGRGGDAAGLGALLALAAALAAGRRRRRSR